MKRRGHPDSVIRKLVYDNPLAFWRQSVRWEEWPVEETKAKKKEKARV
jgi:hypothetical protein